MDNSIVTVRERMKNGSSVGFEGTITVLGMKNTKMTRQDGTTVFPTRSALSSSIRSLRKRTGMTLETVSSTSTTMKKAAKKSATRTSKKCTSKKL